MPQRLRALALVPLTLLVLFAAVSPIAAAAPASPIARMMAAIDHVREANGVATVRASSVLARDSSAYARLMLGENRWAHAVNFRIGTGFQDVGEILGRCPCKGPSIGPIVTAWINSPEHRAILLGGQFGYAGAGYARGKMGAVTMTVWVVRFGAEKTGHASPGLRVRPLVAPIHLGA